MFSPNDIISPSFAFLLLHPSQLQESVASRVMLGAATWTRPAPLPRDALRGASEQRTGGVLLLLWVRSGWRKWTDSLLAHNLVLSSRIHQHQPLGPPQLEATPPHPCVVHSLPCVITHVNRIIIRSVLRVTRAYTSSITAVCHSDMQQKCSCKVIHNAPLLRDTSYDNKSAGNITFMVFIVYMIHLQIMVHANKTSL